MAGDVKTVDSDEQLPTPDYQNPFPGILGELQKIAESLGAIAEQQPATFLIVNGSAPVSIAQHQWQRLHISRLVVFASAAGGAILTIGTRAINIQVGVGATDVPLVDTIERGVDVALTGPANLTGWLIATPE